MYKMEESVDVSVLLYSRVTDGTSFLLLRENSEKRASPTGVNMYEANRKCS